MSKSAIFNVKTWWTDHDQQRVWVFWEASKAERQDAQSSARKNYPAGIGPHPSAPNIPGAPPNWRLTFRGNELRHARLPFYTVGQVLTDARAQGNCREFLVAMEHTFYASHDATVAWHYIFKIGWKPTTLGGLSISMLPDGKSWTTCQIPNNPESMWFISPWRQS